MGRENRPGQIAQASWIQKCTGTRLRLLSAQLLAASLQAPWRGRGRSRPTPVAVVTCSRAVVGAQCGRHAWRPFPGRGCRRDGSPVAAFVAEGSAVAARRICTDSSFSTATLPAGRRCRQASDSLLCQEAAAICVLSAGGQTGSTIRSGSGVLPVAGGWLRASEGLRSRRLACGGRQLASIMAICRVREAAARFTAVGSGPGNGSTEKCGRAL
jgi:hypothetical protein